MAKYQYFKRITSHKYECTFQSEDAEYICKKLLDEIIAKKLDKCLWIKSIKREYGYPCKKITVYYDHGGKGVYYYDS